MTGKRVQEILWSQLVEGETRIRELENKLCDYDDVVAERDYLKKKESSVGSWMKSIIEKQKMLFDELISSYDELCGKYQAQQEQIQKGRNENDCLRCELADLSNRCQIQEHIIIELETAKSDLEAETCKLRKNVTEAVEQSKQLRVKLNQETVALEGNARQLAMVQREVADKKAKREEIENKIAEAQEKNASLRSAMTELKIATDNTIVKLQTDLTGLQCQLNARTADLSEAKKTLEERQQKLDAQTDRVAKMKKTIEELREEHTQEKCKINDEVYSLKVELDATGKELIMVNKQLCDAQDNGEKLKCQVDEQVKEVRRLESTLAQQRQDAQKCMQTVELAAQKHAAEREQLVNELNLRDKTIGSITQDICDLKRTVEERSRQIRLLKSQLADFKCSATQKVSEILNTIVPNKCAEELTEKKQAMCNSQNEGDCVQLEIDESQFKAVADSLKEHLDNFDESLNEMKKMLNINCN